MQTTNLYRVTYTVTGEWPSATATVSRHSATRNPDGSYTTTVDLTFAREQGTYSDEEAVRRIVAIVHPGGNVPPAAVELVAATGIYS